MQNDDLVAFVPLDKATAKKQGKKDAHGIPKGWDMTPEAVKAGVVATETSIDYFLPL
jgi:hypothetical protein